MTNKIIISIHHTAAANTLLLLPPPPRCRRISKCTAATAKIALPPSYRFRHQAEHRRRAAAATIPATTLPMMRYRCLQNIKQCNTIDQPFFHHDGNSSTQRQRQKSIDLH
jgi:hypothetical protein